MTYSILPRLRRTTRVWTWYAVCAPLLAPGSAHASFLHGEALDNVADAMS